MINAFIPLFLERFPEPETYHGDFRDMKGFVGDIFITIFVWVGIAAVIAIVSYIAFTLWRDRKTRPLSVKIKDYINDCKVFWTSKQVKDAIRDVARDLFLTFLVFVAIGLCIYYYCK